MVECCNPLTMKMMKLKFGMLLAAVGTSAAAFVCVADIKNGFVAKFSTSSGVAYELAPSGSDNFLSLAGAYGNQINLDGADHGLTEFSFGYNSDFAYTGGIAVALYDNTGTGPLGELGYPGTQLYHSTSSIDIESGKHMVTIFYDHTTAIVPLTLTFTVSFGGTDANHHAGLLLPDADPTTGSLAFQDYFHELPGGGYVLEHSSSVPEPSTYALAGAAGLAWLAFAGYRRVRK